MDKIRVTLTVPLTGAAALMSAVSSLQSALGASLLVDIKNLKGSYEVAPPAAAEAAPAARPADRRVIYALVPGTGQTMTPGTVAESIRAHLATSGPASKQTIMLAFPARSSHSVESAIHLLQQKGLVRSEPLASAPVAATAEETL